MEAWRDSRSSATAASKRTNSFDTFGLSAESKEKIRKIFHDPALSLDQDPQCAEKVAKLAEQERKSEEQLQIFGSMLTPNIPEPKPGTPITTKQVNQVLWEDFFKLRNYLMESVRNTETEGNQRTRKRGNSV